MGKTKRGRNIHKTAGWRGVCPICKRTRVKLLWTGLSEDKKDLKVCKLCGK